MAVESKSPAVDATGAANVDGAKSGFLTGDLGWLLSQAHFGLASEMSAAFEEVGVSPRAYCVLKTAMSRDRTQIELAEEVGLDKTTMVVTIDELEAAGYAERRPAEHDRRARVIKVTPTGRRKVAAAGKVAERVKKEVLAALPAARREALIEALRQLVTGPLAEPTPCSSVRRREPR